MAVEASVEQFNIAYTHGSSGDYELTQ